MKKKELEKISFSKIKDVLSRYEMRNIMAGSDGGGTACYGICGNLICCKCPDGRSYCLASVSACLTFCGA